MAPGICLEGFPTPLGRSLRPLGLPRCVPPSLITPDRGAGLLTGCPSPTAPALGLGPPHPQLTSIAAEPFGIRWGGFAPPSRYSSRHSHSPPLQGPSQDPFPADGDAPLPPRGSPPGPAASVVGFAPPHRRCTGTRPVSCYALFQGWLLLSQPPGCLGARTSLPTQPTLGDLSRRSGLFPSRPWTFSPTVSLPAPRQRPSEVGSTW